MELQFYAEGLEFLWDELQISVRLSRIFQNSICTTIVVDKKYRAEVEEWISIDINCILKSLNFIFNRRKDTKNYNI